MYLSEGKYITFSRIFFFAVSMATSRPLIKLEQPLYSPNMEHVPMASPPLVYFNGTLTGGLVPFFQKFPINAE